MNNVRSFKEFITESKKPKGAPDWHDSDAPDAEGRFRDLNPKDLAAWLIKSRKKDLKKITGSLNQQIVFNRNRDSAYAKKMEKTRKEVYKQLGREDLLEESKELIIESKLSSFLDLEIGEVYRFIDVNSSGDDITADYKYVGEDRSGSLHFKLIRHFLKPEVLKKYKKSGMDWKTGNSMWTGKGQINLDIKKNRIKKIDNEAAKKEWYKFYKENY